MKKLRPDEYDWITKWIADDIIPELEEKNPHYLTNTQRQRDILYEFQVAKQILEKLTHD